MSTSKGYSFIVKKVFLKLQHLVFWSRSALENLEKVRDLMATEPTSAKEEVEREIRVVQVFLYS